MNPWPQLGTIFTVRAESLKKVNNWNEHYYTGQKITDENCLSKKKQILDCSCITFIWLKSIFFGGIEEREGEYKKEKATHSRESQGFSKSEKNFGTKPSMKTWKCTSQGGWYNVPMQHI